MPKAKSKISYENSKLEDAKEFKNMLMIRTENKKRTKKSMKFDREGGKEIEKYLDEVVPDWKFMNATRLYKHIQSMLDKADEIRRFEIELVWRRLVYIVPLAVSFFTAFGYMFYSAYENGIIFGNIDETISKDSNQGDKMYGGISENSFTLILATMALINAFLTFCLTMINLHSHQWQKNWEYHVDYLQAILGVNMIRSCLQKKTERFTIRKANVFIFLAMLAVWLYVALVNSVAGMLILLTSPKCVKPYQLNFCEPSEMLNFILAISFTVFIIFCIFYAIATVKCFFGESGEKMITRPLEKLDYVVGPPPPPKKYIDEIIVALFPIILITLHYLYDFP